MWVHQSRNSLSTWTRLMASITPSREAQTTIGWQTEVAVSRVMDRLIPTCALRKKATTGKPRLCQLLRGHIAWSLHRKQRAQTGPADFLSENYFWLCHLMNCFSPLERIFQSKEAGVGHPKPDHTGLRP